MLTVGLDLGGTKCLGLVLDDNGAVVGEHRLATPTSGGEAIVDTLAQVVDALVAAAGEVAAVGVGAPGLVTREGVLRDAPNLVAADELPVGPHLRARLGLPVFVDNDATAATWGERVRGAGVGHDDMVMVTLGTGIGGGIVSNGRLDRGAHGFAGEVGHMIVDPDGPECPCGRRGCWERYASGSGLGRLGRDAAAAGRAARVLDLAGGAVDAVRGEHVVTAATEGDAGARAVVDEFGWWTALGLANLASIFDPELFVVGGGLVAAGDVVLEPTRRAFPDLLQAREHRPPIPIVAAALGERAGAIGAASFARERSGAGALK